jgi:hypothetical protein
VRVKSWRVRLAFGTAELSARWIKSRESSISSH